jgi:hypothetical protein
MQVENGGGVNCFELHRHLQGSAADQTISKEAALLLVASPAAHDIFQNKHHVKEQIYSFKTPMNDENDPNIYLTSQSPVRLFSVLAKDKQNGVADRSRSNDRSICR